MGFVWNISIIFGENSPAVILKKIVSIGFFALLVYHTLAYVLVFMGSWWQEEHDLSERLSVYRSVDSIVEFEIPLKDKLDANSIARTTSDGFSHHGHYYSVVSVEVRDNMLHIAGLESQSRSFWQSDLLSFLNDHVSGATDSHKKANQFLKFLLKEYSATPRTVFSFLSPNWRDAVRIPEQLFVIATCALPVHSPPPEVWGEFSIAFKTCFSSFCWQFCRAMPRVQRVCVVAKWYYQTNRPQHSLL